jgi:hypothetical protein
MGFDKRIMLYWGEIMVFSALFWRSLFCVVTFAPYEITAFVHTNCVALNELIRVK